MGQPSRKKENASVQACTDLYKEKIIDHYTIKHFYQKGRKKITTSYTLPQVETRIAQYERSIKEAVDKNLGKDLVDNRQERLDYCKKSKQN